jgi:hypothetical protein
MTSKDENTVNGRKKPVFLSDLTKRFRIVLEEGSERGADHLGFCQLIPCKGFRPGPGQSGPFIGLHSEAPLVLMLYTDRVQNAKNIWNAIEQRPGTRADFALDGEALIFFGPELLKIVAEMAGGRKRRQLSAEHRAKLVEAGKAGRAALKKWRAQRVQSQNSTPNEAPGPQAMENDVGIGGSVF